MSTSSLKLIILIFMVITHIEQFIQNTSDKKEKSNGIDFSFLNIS